MSAIITISGRLTAEPTLRFSQSGNAVASFTVAHTERKYDKSTNQWVDDGDTLFLDVTAFSGLGEGAAETLKKGDMVTVTGKLRQRNWEKDGQKRVNIYVLADQIGSSVRARKGAGSAVSQQPAELPW